MIKILQFSDLHLGRPFKHLPEDQRRQRQQDLLDALHRIIDLAIAEAVQLLLVPGDVFDPKMPTLSLVEYVRHEFERFAATGGHIALIPGNHDGWLGESTPAHAILSGAKNLHLMTSPEWNHHLVRINDVDLYLYGFPFVKSEPFSRPLTTFQKQANGGIHIILLHGSYAREKASRFTETELYHPFSDEEIEQTGADYIAVGHYHRLIQCASDIPAWYAGSPEGLRFNSNEEGPRHCLLITIDDANSVQVEQRVINQKEIFQLSYDVSLTQIDTISNELRKLADPTRLVRVKFTGTLPNLADLEQFSTLAEQFQVLFFHFDIDHSRVAFSDELLSGIDERSPEGIFVKTMTDHIDHSPADDDKQLWQEALVAGVQALKLAG